MRLSIEAWGSAVNPARKDYALRDLLAPETKSLTPTAALFMVRTAWRAAASCWPPPHFFPREDGWIAMKIKNSLRALRNRHRNNRVVRRRGRLYVINKTNRRYKARQG